MFCAFTSIGILPISLHRISMEVYLVLPGDCTEFRDRFNRSDLIVGIHNRDQDRLVGDRLFEDPPGQQARTGQPGDT